MFLAESFGGKTICRRSTIEPPLLEWFFCGRGRASGVGTLWRFSARCSCPSCPSRLMSTFAESGMTTLSAPSGFAARFRRSPSSCSYTDLYIDLDTACLFIEFLLLPSSATSSACDGRVRMLCDLRGRT